MKSAKISFTVISGLIAGVLMILLATILYRGGVEAYMGDAGYLAYVILIVLAFIATVNAKKKNNGYLEFRDALKTAFLVFVIALAMYAIYIHILLNYIDRPFGKAVDNAALERTERVMQRFGSSQQSIDDMRERGKHQSEPSISQVLLGLAMYYVLFFIVALLIAAIVKKKKPEFKDKALK